MSISYTTYPKGVWLVDTEFHPEQGVEGSLPVPVCLVAFDVISGQTIRVGQSELASLTQPPFPIDSSSLVVAFFGTAEIGIFNVLGWKHPENFLDLYSEFRWLTNGRILINKDGKKKAQKYGLLDALTYFGINDGISSQVKEQMRDLVLSRGPWSAEEQALILDYCESDVKALSKLLPLMESKIDMPRALLRGRYVCAVAKMESNGVPIDTHLFKKLLDNWDGMRDRMIASIDKSYDVFEGATFKRRKFEQYLQREGIHWPVLKTSGALDLKDDTFKSMSTTFPQLQPLRELRNALSKMRLISLQVGVEGRNRCLLSPFSSTTSRNQPSTNKFIFGPAVFLRGLIRPPEGWAVAYVDWSQQEFGAAAALSGDSHMKEAYSSGDPYLAFAIQANAVPSTATKNTHKVERELFKSCVLAQQYGMGSESLAIKINRPEIVARNLIKLHHQTYPKYWQWVENVLNEAQHGNRKIWTNFGWQIYAGDNERSLQNFPVQAHSAELMRVASIMLVADGIRVCCPVHDAFLIEAPISEIDAVVERTQYLMTQASRVVLDGFELGSDAKIIKYPDRFMDDRGVEMWNVLMELLDEPKY